MARRKRTLWILVLLCVALAIPVAQGVRLYKWVDKDGNVSYHDRPPPSPEGYQVESRDFKLRGGGQATSAAVDKASEQFPVVLYTVPQCSSCDLARAYLDRRKIPFTDKDVAKDVTLQKELVDKTGSLTVPTIMVGERIMKGYMESLLAGELDAAGYPRIETAQSSESSEQSESTESTDEQQRR
ncbi:MAG: glutaredoxin family protein [Acidiferrobacterales bacterium]|nr:glutaredoxin family protein [Acidiferrobacterales bacterium]